MKISCNLERNLKYFFEVFFLYPGLKVDSSWWETPPNSIFYLRVYLGSPNILWKFHTFWSTKCMKFQKKKFFAGVFPYPGLILDISLLETLSNSFFFLRVYLVDCNNWYNFQAIWSVISHGISIVVLKFRIGLFWILLYKPHYVRFLDFKELFLRKKRGKINRLLKKIF